MTREHLLVAASIVALTLVGYFQFPGHTYLQSDTQVYVPILEHYSDPSVLNRDMLVHYPHVSFTIYDEVTLALRKLTGLGFEKVLDFQQLVFRGLGIFGVFLIATALNLSTRMSLLVAAAFSLGATIGGPTVLTFEYEPIPRGFAIPLTLLAIGFVAHGRDLSAGIAASLAFLYQAPTVYTFWGLYFCLTLLPGKPAVMRRRIFGLLPLLFSVIALLFLSRLQPGVSEPQPFLGQLSPWLEKLQRMRAPYNWVTLWQPYWYWHYAFLWAVCFGAFFRLRKDILQDLRFFLVGMPLLGIASLPLSYLLLERLRWVLIPQIQPMRAVLFVTAFAGILAAVAGIRAAQNRQYLESILWLAVPFAIPSDPRVLDVLLPNPTNPASLRKIAVVLALAIVTTLIARAETTRRRWEPAAWAIALLAPFFLIPDVGKVLNYEDLHTPELKQLAQWAHNSTDKDALFLFPDAGRDLYPGIFRATAPRAVYVDWKTGGQVNFFEKLAELWWERWGDTMAGKFDPSKFDHYASLRIDYIVVRPEHRLSGRQPVFANPKFLVYRVG